MRVFRLILMSVLIFILCSCSSTLYVSDFYEWYEPWISQDDIDSIYSECLLQEGEEPVIYYSDDIYSDIESMFSKYYIVLGVSSFNGVAYDGVYDAVYGFCKDAKAKVAIYTVDYTDTRNGVFGYDGYVSSYSIDRFDYVVYLLIPSPSWLVLLNSIIGLSYSDLEMEDRVRSGSNTGVVVDIVYEDTPAFYGNLIKGDIITRINDETVIDSDCIDSILGSMEYGTSFDVTFIRNGIEQSTTLQKSSPLI